MGKKKWQQLSNISTFNNDIGHPVKENFSQEKIMETKKMAIICSI